jgi:hypothetical protein
MAEFKDPIDSKSLSLLAVSISVLAILIASGARQALEVNIQTPTAPVTVRSEGLPESSHLNVRSDLAAISQQPAWASDPQSMSYDLDGRQVAFQRGTYELKIPGSASKYTYRFTGSSLGGDINGDGKLDAIGIVTEENAGSGVFYYVVAAVSENNTLKPLPAYLVGDRIQPEALYVKGDAIGFKYLDRPSGSSMTTPASISKKLVLEVKDGKLIKY